MNSPTRHHHFLLLLLLLFLTLTPPTHSRALIALDRTLSSPLVTQLNTTIHYTLHNIGTHAATSLSLKDHSFPISRFHIHSGTFRHSIPLLQPQQTYSTSAVVTPKRHGSLIVAPASVTYKDHLDRLHVGSVAVDEELVVEHVVEWRRRNDSFVTEWAVYAAMFVVLVLAPWFVSRLVERSIVDTKKKA